jgi:hypothetical protein
MQYRATDSPLLVTTLYHAIGKVERFGTPSCDYWLVVSVPSLAYVPTR